MAELQIIFFFLERKNVRRQVTKKWKEAEKMSDIHYTDDIQISTEFSLTDQHVLPSTAR